MSASPSAWIILAAAALALVCAVGLVLLAGKKPGKLDLGVLSGSYLPIGIALGLALGIALEPLTRDKE